MQPQIQAFHDSATGTISYVVHSGRGSDCAIIDSVLDFDPKSGRTATVGADRILDFVHAQALRCAWLLETHAHADHLSAAPHLQRQLGGRIAIGAAIALVRKEFAAVFPSAAHGFDHLFQPGEEFMIGPLRAHALHVPGHTPADMAYRIGDTVFVGDTLFMPDVGTARCDFPGGCAAMLYRSIRRLLALPPHTRLYMCHDYPPAGRDLRWEVTVAEQRRDNIHVRDGITEHDFVAMRSRRDATLEMPVLLLPAIQVNLNAGQLPVAEENGVQYLKIPLNAI